MTIFSFCGSYEITKNSLVFENNPVVLDNRASTSRWVRVPTSSPQRKHRKKLVLGLSAGELAFAAWPTSCLPFAILPGWCSGWCQASVKIDDMVKIIPRGHSAFLTCHHVVNERALTIQFPITCQGERRVGFGMRYPIFKSTWIKFGGNFPFLVQYTALRMVLYTLQLFHPPNKQMQATSPLTKIKGWL